MSKKLALLLALVMVCATMLTACGKKAADITGTTWTLSSMEADGEKYTTDMLEKMDAIVTYEFKKDGVLTSSAYEEDGTWEQDGNKVTMAFVGSAVEGEIDGDKMDLEVASIKMVLKKN